MQTGRRPFLVGLALMLAVSLPSAGSAAGPASPQEEERVTARMAVLGGVEKDSVTVLRQRQMSWNDVARTLVVSQLSGKPVITVAWLRESGMAWDEIAKKSGLDPNTVESQARSIETAALGG